MAVHQNVVVLAAFILSAVLLLATYHRSSLFPDMGVGEHSSHSHKPRYIFVDLGANRGDTLDVFLKRENSKFEFDFPRPDWATYEQAECYLFEANPYFNTALVKAKEQYDALGIKVTIFPSTVVDIRDGTRTFFLDTVNDAYDFWGSSIYASHPDAVKSQSTGTELSAINISRWLLMNTQPQDFVVVKMDIEGAEYQVIPHMAENSVWTVMDYLLVEWHLGVPEDPAFTRASAKAAEEKLKVEGVNMPAYDSPA